MKKAKILSIIVCGVLSMTTLMPAYAATKAAADTGRVEVSDDYINPAPSQLIIEANNDDVLPKNFRTTKDKIPEEKAKGIDFTGFSNVNMSGSGSPSENGLKQIKKRTEGYELYDVDLRQESHGIVDGMVMSWSGERDNANRGLTEKQVLTDEKNRLDKVRKDGHAKIDVLPGESLDLGEINNVKKVETEEDLAKELGIGYIRIQVSDHYRPDAAQIDEFVAFVNSLPENAWLNFHCRAGKGRTAVFMCMYDMMKNAKKVSFEDLVNREIVIGGSDLHKGNAEDKANPGNTRLDGLKEFYNYCIDNNDNFKTSYSEYESAKAQKAQKEKTEDVKKNAWVANGDKWNYVDENGKEVKNSWKEINSKWYYFNEDGTMKTGWFQYEKNSKWYFLKSDGQMAKSEYVGEYWINENGEWA